MRSNHAVQRRDDRSGRMALGERREAAQIRIEERGGDRLAFVPPERRGHHPRGAAPAEIGLERRRQCGARRERSDRRRGKARGLAEVMRLVRGEGAQAAPRRGSANPVSARPRPRARGPPRRQRATTPGVAREPWRGRASRGEAQALDDLAVPGAPKPGPPGDQGVGDVERQGAAGQRQAVRDQMRAEFGEQFAGASALGRRIDEPGERRVHPHGRDHGPDAVPLSRAMPISGLS